MQTVSVSLTNSQGVSGTKPPLRDTSSYHAERELYMYLKVKVNQFRYKPGVAQRVPGS